MTISDWLAWIVGIGTLLYFAAAMINPAWFIGDEADATISTPEDGERQWSRPIESDAWQHLGQPR